MEMNIGCTDPTQATSRLLIVLLRRLPKSGCKEKLLTFSNGKGRFGPTDRKDWSKWTAFQGGPKYSCRKEPKWSVAFDFLPKIAGI